MMVVIAILLCAALFALFGALRPRRGSCGGSSCSSCNAACDLNPNRDGAVWSDQPGH